MLWYPSDCCVHSDLCAEGGQLQMCIDQPCKACAELRQHTKVSSKLWGKPSPLNADWTLPHHHPKGRHPIPPDRPSLEASELYYHWEAAQGILSNDLMYIENFT